MLKIAVTLYGEYIHRKKIVWEEHDHEHETDEMKEVVNKMSKKVWAYESVMQLHVLDFSPLSRFLKEVLLK